jgi:hypothetical protein
MTQATRRGPSKLLPCSYHYLPPAYRLSEDIVSACGRFAKASMFRWQLCSIRDVSLILSGREGCNAVVACTGDVTLLPAVTWQPCDQSSLLRLRFRSLLFVPRSGDDSHRRILGARLERLSDERGRWCVIAPNEILRNDLQERFGVDARRHSQLIRHLALRNE